MRKISKPALYLAIIAGAAAVYLFPKLNALYAFIFLIALTVFIIARNKEEKDRAFLITIVLLMFISRFLVSLFVMDARGAELWQDEGLYSKKALMEACKMKGAQDLEPLFRDYFDDSDMMSNQYGYNIYTHILAGFYYLFGYQIQAARMINIFLSIIIFLLLFNMAKELFDSRAAKLSSAIYAFFPSTLLWSVMLSVDMTAFLCILAYFYSLIRMMKRFEFKWPCVMAMALLALYSIRPYIVVILLSLAALIPVCRFCVWFVKKARIASLALAFLLIFIVSNPLFMSLGENKIQEKIQLMAQRQRNFAIADDAGYLVYPKDCYQGGRCGAFDFFKSYAKGMSYAVFSPFPWQIESKQQLMAYPQIIFLYLILPFIIYGFYAGYKKNRPAASSILAYSFIMFSIFALVEGNIGAVFRHRDMVTPFFLIYFAGGVYGLLHRYPKVKF